MTSRRIRSCLAIGLCGLVALSASCEKKKKVQPPPPIQNDPVPPPPEPVDIQALLQASGASGVIQFPAHHAPTSERLARAIIAFCDAFARGHDTALADMLDDSGQSTLDVLLDDGSWEAATSRIEALRIVQCLQVGETGIFRFAIQEPGKAYVLAWTAIPIGSNYIFKALPSPDTTLTRASDFDTFVDPDAGGFPGLPGPPGPLPGGTPPAPGNPPDPSGPPGRSNTPGIG